MRILAADDELLQLNKLKKAILDVEPEADLITFSKPSEILEWAKKGEHIDIAFLDIEMGSATGIEIATKLKENNSELNIIFVTGFTTYALDAFEISASGYVTKPVTSDKIKTEMQRLRYPIANGRNEKKLRVQCFGNFEVFVDDKPVHFARTKSKELFAYLVDRNGAICNMDMIIGNIWPDRAADKTSKSMARTVIAEMTKTFTLLGVDVFVHGNGIGVDTNKIECDYYRLLKGDEQAKHEFTGEYMSQYEFADMTRSYLYDKYFL